MFILVRAIEKTLIYKLDDMLYALKGFQKIFPQGTQPFIPINVQHYRMTGKKEPSLNKFFIN